MRQTVGVTMNHALRWLATTSWLAAIAAASVSISTMVAQPLSATKAGGLDDALPDLVEVPAGPFVMGADPARDPLAFDNERWSPAAGEGTVDVPAFYIARHETTVAQFAAFARDTTRTVHPQSLTAPPTHPVTFVSWPDALAYCRWLTTTLERSPATSPRRRALVRAGWRVSLPTEAEWEKAARGPDRRRYPWGDEPLRARANYENTITTPVGQFACPECPYGLSDMSGNVWEWTRSPNQPYPYDPADDRENLEADALWIMRGGHFGDGPRLVRTSTRGAADPGARRAFIGFRVVLTRPAPTAR